MGKSSIINMLVGEHVAAVSNQAAGCTYTNDRFRATIAGREVMLYDTAGLNEAETGTVSHARAIQNLRSLVNDLKTVNLLVYCIRGTRFRKIIAKNYKLICNNICGRHRKVPVLLVITGLENEHNMDDWWEENKGDFGGMEFCGHACITAIRGKGSRDDSGYIFQDLYDASKTKLMQLLEEHAFKSSITIAPPKYTPTSTCRVSDVPSDIKPWYLRILAWFIAPLKPWYLRTRAWLIARVVTPQVLGPAGSLIPTDSSTVLGAQKEYSVR